MRAIACCANRPTARTMKYWPSQFLPLVLLVVLALLSFWLRQAAEQVSPVEAKAPAHIPDAIGKDVVARRYDVNGELRYRLTSPHLEHFPDDDSTELRSPILVSYRQEAQPITLSAEHARVTAKGEHVLLTENVRIVRPASNERSELVARTQELTVLPEQGLAHTQRPVDIRQGNSWVTGVGMHIDNNNATMTLESNVRGEYISPKVKP